MIATSSGEIACETIEEDRADPVFDYYIMSIYATSHAQLAALAIRVHTEFLNVGDDPTEIETEKLVERITSQYPKDKTTGTR